MFCSQWSTTFYCFRCEEVGLRFPFLPPLFSFSKIPCCRWDLFNKSVFIMYYYVKKEKKKVDLPASFDVMLTGIFYCQSRMILQFVPIYSGDWSPFSYISCVKPFVDESILLSGLWQIFVLLYMKLLLLCCCCVHVFVFITPLTLRTWYVYLQHLWRQRCWTVSFVLPWCWHQIKTVHCNPF